MLVTHDRHPCPALYRFHQRSRLTQHLHHFQKNAYRKAAEWLVILGSQRPKSITTRSLIFPNVSANPLQPGNTGTDSSFNNSLNLSIFLESISLFRVTLYGAAR